MHMKMENEMRGERDDLRDRKKKKTYTKLQREGKRTREREKEGRDSCRD